MINYIVSNVYEIIIGLFIAFIISYYTVQNFNHKYEYAEITPQMRFLVRSVLTILPFLTLFLLIVVLSM